MSTFGGSGVRPEFDVRRRVGEPLEVPSESTTELRQDVGFYKRCCGSFNVGPNWS
jgi:hypothetical protein